ncbi:hypothetical protein [Neorhizobium turbinariae]|nr:hypothetical protein [Neorhizobium turbinariae]
MVEQLQRCIQSQKLASPPLCDLSERPEWSAGGLEGDRQLSTGISHSPDTSARQRWALASHLRVLGGIRFGIGSGRWTTKIGREAVQRFMRYLAANLRSKSENYCRSTILLTEAQSQGTKVASTVARGRKYKDFKEEFFKRLKMCKNPDHPGKSFLTEFLDLNWRLSPPRNSGVFSISWAISAEVPSVVFEGG